MSECTGDPAERFLEPYIEGTLPEAQAQEFEEHYFGCKVCLAKLNTLQTVTLKLGARPRGRVIRWPVNLAAAGAIAATLLLVLLGRQAMMRNIGPKQEVAQRSPAPQQSHPAEAAVNRSSLRLLADMNLPVFQLALQRGQTDNPAFEVGMHAYARRDCAAAVKALGQVKAPDDKAPMARLYSGVCLMKEGQISLAAQNLKAASQARGSAEQEAAWYYLAQISLINEDATAARHYLSLTIASHGSFELRAQSELKQVPANSARP